MNNLDALFYQNPQPMWVYAINSLLILEVNEAAIKRYGYSREEFIGKSTRDLRPVEDIHLLEEILNSKEPKDIYESEFRHVTKSGTVFHVEIQAYDIVYNDVPAKLIQAQCIEAKKDIQGKLQLTESKLNRLLDSTTIGFYQLDPNGNITYWNNAAEKLLGYNREYVLGKNIWDVFPEAVHSDFYTYIEKASAHKVNVEFTEYFWPIQRWFFTNAYPGEDGILVHFRDVTHIKLAQEILLEKIEQLKEISFLNSHYIRKPVASLLGLTNLIKENVIRPEEFKEIAEQVQACSYELDDVIKTINKKVNDGDGLKELAFEMAEFCINDLLKDVICDYKNTHPTQQKHNLQKLFLNGILLLIH